MVGTIAAHKLMNICFESHNPPVIDIESWKKGLVLVGSIGSQKALPINRRGNET